MLNKLTFRPPIKSTLKENDPIYTYIPICPGCVSTLDCVANFNHKPRSWHTWASLISKFPGGGKLVSFRVHSGHEMALYIRANEIYLYNLWSMLSCHLKMSLRQSCQYHMSDGVMTWKHFHTVESVWWDIACHRWLLLTNYPWCAALILSLL